MVLDEQPYKDGKIVLPEGDSNKRERTEILKRLYLRIYQKFPNDRQRLDYIRELCDNSISLRTLNSYKNDGDWETDVIRMYGKPKKHIKQSGIKLKPRSERITVYEKTPKVKTVERVVDITGEDGILLDSDGDHNALLRDVLKKWETGTYNLFDLLTSAGISKGVLDRAIGSDPTIEGLYHTTKKKRNTNYSFLLEEYLKQRILEHLKNPFLTTETINYKYALVPQPDGTIKPTEKAMYKNITRVERAIDHQQMTFFFQLYKAIKNEADQSSTALDIYDNMEYEELLREETKLLAARELYLRDNPHLDQKAVGVFTDTENVSDTEPQKDDDIFESEL